MLTRMPIGMPIGRGTDVYMDVYRRGRDAYRKGRDGDAYTDAYRKGERYI